MNQTINQQLAEIRNNMLAITQNHKENEVNANQPQPQAHAGQAGQTIQVKINPRGKGTMSAQVRKLLRTQPDLTPREIAKIVGCNPHTVHNVKYQQKKKRRIKTIQVKPRKQNQPAVATQPSQAKTFGHLVHLSPIKAAVANLTMDLIASGNTDLLKNKHFQNLVRLTTTPENTQL